MKLFYKPFALIFAVIATRIGKAVYKNLWSAIDDNDPPEPSAPNARFGKVVLAAALEAVTMASIAAAVDRASAHAFHHLTGVWPGDESDTK